MAYRQNRQCSKSRVHPAPSVHILDAGCIDSAPCVCMIFVTLKLVYIE